MVEFIKFILSDFNLKNLIRDAIIWDGFKLLLQKIFSVITKKTNKPTEIQVWIEDKNNPASVNIALSIKKIEDIQELMVSLKAKLEVEIFSVSKEQQKGKIFWITLDKDSQNWLVKIL